MGIVRCCSFLTAAFFPLAFLQAGAMITKLVDGALFPELSTAQHGNGAEGTQALAELFPHTLQTASRGMFCREVRQACCHC